MRKSIIIGVIVILVIVVIAQYFMKQNGNDLETVQVVFGDIVQEISETGQVKKGEKINLNFKSSGIIENILATIGQEVKQGDILATLDDSELTIQLVEAGANLDLAKAELNKLISGATQEDIQIAHTNIDNAQIGLDNAEKALADVNAQGQEDLDSAYGDALNVLDDSYIAISSAKNKSESIKSTYFTLNDQEGFSVRENVDRIQEALNTVAVYVDTAKSSESDTDIDTALSQMKAALQKTSNALNIIREMTDTDNYRNTVTSANKTVLDTERDSINTALTNIVNSQQTIATTKIDNTANNNTYQTKVDTAQGDLKYYQDQLTKLLAPPRSEDVNLYQAKVRQAQAKVDLLYDQIQNTKLKAPIDGQIAEINKRKGEIVQPTFADGVIILSPKVPFEIEVDIYEEDVVGVQVGAEVNISLIAFPEKTLKGSVLSVDPAEKIIDGVVYYEVTIGFSEEPEGIKSGMTADLVIRTGFKPDVLIIPESTISEKDDKSFVQVLRNGEVKEQKIETGLYGVDDVVEILSGLEEGETIIIP